ncbi:MAG: glutamine--fructose-6-phosphate transaminase (isomerizing) [Candidatus Melainabacteria bacterium]|jgi:glucosamine--fructose-6-phosphate aminotransferase (isomerizing)|nr:glutamine--fructose-6-phosphate transaminase (isomerizing) [Candidatus Melainabacteria bacterium]MBX9672354.1 glutamine--fructose-6-phosphate transaminase (isomerizing) [Candidatus Obscuribacterales bacterium]
MCGIVGYLGPENAAPVLLNELRCLEYRGYDSAGVAVIEDGKLSVLKAAGKLSNLEALLDNKKPAARVGIGHTRWATHGVPNDQNAHPHMDETGTLAVVHNGIIENYEELREELKGAGYVFKSDTDTEVVVHLVSSELKKDGDLLKAITRSVSKLKGIFALGIVSQSHPDRIYAINHHYSLSVGLGENENFLASDSMAVRQYTNKVIKLEQSEIAEITQTKVRLFTFDGKEVKRSPIALDTSPYVIDKAGYKHFLLKEIHEQPQVLRQTLSKYLRHPNHPIDLTVDHLSSSSAKGLDGLKYGVHLTDQEIKGLDRISIFACGTAYHASLVGKLILEDLVGVPVEVDIASETRGRRLLVNESTLVIAVSQSGETADTLAALKEAKSKGAYTLGITNRADSHLAQLTENLIVTECGIEVSVAATKTYTAQLACFYLLGIYLAEKRGTISSERAKELKLKLNLVPTMIEQILAREEEARETSIKYAEAHDVVFIGRGLNFPTALEGALKLKELSYIHASGYAAGELKHGPIAVLDQHVPVITVLVPGAVYEKTLSNAQEARARKAKMIAVAVEGDEQAKRTFDSVLTIPLVDELFSPMTSVVPMQLMSYFIADYLGKDVDQPRNLAKSVTVE